MPQVRRVTLPLPKRCPAFAAGQIIGEGHRIRGDLAEGSQAALYRLEGGKVLRVYFAGREPSPELRRILRDRRRDGVCPVLESGRADGHEYDIIPELWPLSDGRGLSEEEIRERIRRQVKAVAAFHSLGYLHLDLKPEHFMQDQDGKVFLIDPGSARKKGESGGRPETTPGFAPPEREAGICQESYDWYSFGICLADEWGGGVYPGLAPADIPALPEGSLPPTARPLTGFYRRIVRELVRVDPKARWGAAELLAALSDEPEEREGHSPAVRLVRAGAGITVRPEDRPGLAVRLKGEIVRLAERADPQVFADQAARMRVDWQNPVSMREAWELLRRMPRADGAVNETNITPERAGEVFGAKIRTDFSGSEFRFRTWRGKWKALRAGGELYVMSREWIAEEEAYRGKIADARKRQGAAAAKAAGLAGALVFGIWLFIKLIPVLIILAIAAMFLGLL
jgi:hypothetical protein